MFRFKAHRAIRFVSAIRPAVPRYDAGRATRRPGAPDESHGDATAPMPLTIILDHRAATHFGVERRQGARLGGGPFGDHRSGAGPQLADEPRRAQHPPAERLAERRGRRLLKTRPASRIMRLPRSRIRSPRVRIPWLPRSVKFGPVPSARLLLRCRPRDGSSSRRRVPNTGELNTSGGQTLGQAGSPFRDYEGARSQA
jgi:hypothetical protein